MNSTLQIYIISNDGNNIEVLLDNGKGIRAPTRVCVDDEGARLVIINRDGVEIRNYKINMVISIVNLQNLYLNIFKTRSKRNKTVE